MTYWNNYPNYFRKMTLALMIIGLLPIIVLTAHGAEGQTKSSPAPNSLDFCQGKEQVDLLVVTDQSQSMGKNADRGPDGSPNPGTGFYSVNQALKTINAQLGSSANVNVALIGFAEFSGEGRNRPDFSNRRLSEEEIFQATRQQIEYEYNNGYSTNYSSAFSKAAELFRQSKRENPQNCRILVFFTDGIIENFSGIKDDDGSIV